MSYSEDRRRARYREHLRQEAQQHVADQRHFERQKHISKLLKNRQYVDEHGQAGAFYFTLGKWAVAGVVISVFNIIGNWGEFGFLQGLRNFFLVIFLFAAIGVWRGFSILQSAR